VLFTYELLKLQAIMFFVHKYYVIKVYMIYGSELSVR